MNRTTLDRWKKDPQVQLPERAASLARDQLVSRQTAVYHAITEKALAGSYNHCELFLKLCDQYQEEKSIVLQEDTRGSKVQRRLNDILAETRDEEEQPS